MKLAEYCDTAPSYIGDIEIGRRFPSVELIEKIADNLGIEPYHLFKNQNYNDDNSDTENTYPRLPNSMKKQITTQIKTYIKTHIDRSTGEIFSEINEIINKY